MAFIYYKIMKQVCVFKNINISIIKLKSIQHYYGSMWHIIYTIDSHHSLLSDNSMFDVSCRLDNGTEE